MKNILVPIDFSPNAQTASFFAAELARQLNARLVLVHALFGVFVGDRDYEPEQDVQARLDALAGNLHERYGVSTTRMLKPGLATAEIPLLAKRFQAKAVVLGAQGVHTASGGVGRVAAHMLSSSPFPVLCIPPQAPTEFPQLVACLLQAQTRLCNLGGLRLLSELKPTLDAGASVVG